jgi:hypothetical protein
MSYSALFLDVNLTEKAKSIRQHLRNTESPRLRNERSLKSHARACIAQGRAMGNWNALRNTRLLSAEHDLRYPGSLRADV